MSGGVWEYVMGVMMDQNGKLFSGQNATNNSGFTGSYGEGGRLTTGNSWPEEKYYDKYTYGTSYFEYTRGHFGDATFEVGPFKSIIYANNQTRQINSWYTNQAVFINHLYPWFYRGGVYHNGMESGLFASAHYMGSAHETVGFRVVLTP